jgi:uncharacterized membrane protein YcaP (DUF421 family)
MLDGVPKVLIHNGTIYDRALRAENISMDELEAALREAGTGQALDVLLAILETNGKISVQLRTGR